MHLVLKDGNYKANLFSSLAYFMAGTDLDLFGRTDYSLRLIQQGGDLWVAHPRAALEALDSSPLAHKLDLSLIKEALETREFVIVGGYSGTGRPVFSATLIPSITYLACSVTSPNRVLDLLTQSYVDLQKGQVSPLLFVTKIKGLDTYVAYLDPLFLKTGSMFHPAAEYTVKEVYEQPGYLRDVLICPKITGGQVVGDVVLSTTSEFSLDVLPSYPDSVVGAFLKENCTVESNLPYRLEGRTFHVTAHPSGYFKAHFDMGFVSNLSAEECNVELVVRNIGGASM